MPRDKKRSPIPVGRTCPDLLRLLVSWYRISRDFDFLGTTKPQRGDSYIEHRDPSPSRATGGVVPLFISDMCGL